MQAIQTTYRPATNTRGSRIFAKCSAGSISVPYDTGTSTEGAHWRAAQALCEKLHWQGGDLVSGGLADGSFVFVFTTAPRTPRPSDAR